MAERYIALGEEGIAFLVYLRAADESELGGLNERISILEIHRDLIMTNARYVDRKIRRKLIWLANYHNRVVWELRAGFDPSDPGGDFVSEVGMKPDDAISALNIDARIFGPAKN